MLPLLLKLSLGISWVSFSQIQWARHGLPNDLGIQGWVRPRRDFGIKQGVFAMMLAGGLTLFLLTETGAKNATDELKLVLQRTLIAFSF